MSKTQKKKKIFFLERISSVTHRSDNNYNEKLAHLQFFEILFETINQLLVIVRIVILDKLQESTF